MDTSPLPDPPALWECTWLTGPDAGGHRLLGPGRHLIGRAHTAAVRCDDPSLEPHHALLDVQPDGALSVTQLTGRAPIIVADGHTDHVEPSEAMAADPRSTIALEGERVLTGATRLEVAGSTLGLRRPVADAPPAHVHDGVVVRSPRAVPQWQPTDLTAPLEPDRRTAAAGGLLPAVLGLCGAGVIALVLGQPMFLLFGALGALVALGSWAAQRVAALRHQRRDDAAHLADCQQHSLAVWRERTAFHEYRTATVPTVATARRVLAERQQALWARRATHPDAYLVAIGVGDVALPGHDQLADGMLPIRDVPIAADLGPGSRLAVHGPRAVASVRAMLAQLVASCGPADLRVVVVSDRAAAWDCVRGLPHLTRPDGSAMVVTEAELPAALADLAGHTSHLLFVTDQPALLATRTSPLRRALADPALYGLVVAVAADDGVPHLCTSVLTLSSGPVGRWVGDTRATLLPTSVRTSGLGEQATFACTAALRGLVDPEDPLSVASGVPREVSLPELLAGGRRDALTPTAIAERWQAAGADPSPRTLIGMAADGAVDIDLVRDGPHGLIAGTTGAGKSELLRSLVAGMAANASPAHLSFVLVDYKGGATFDACAGLPHVVGVITDLDDHLADRALRSLHAELRRREAVLRDHGVADLPGLRAVAPQLVLPRLVVVIDEFAALVAEQPAFLHALVGVAQRGRSLGVHLLLATQRPNGVISDDIRANTNLRIALRLQDTADAVDVVGIAAPALLPRGLPGRAVMRLGADDHLTFQTARCTTATARADAGETVLSLLVRAISEATRLVETPSPSPPWQPALPTVLERQLVPTGAIGLVDDPDNQRLLPLRWSHDDGHLLLVGAAGSGTTSTLITLATQVLAGREAANAGAHVYVLDGRGDERLAVLAAHPRCGAVIGIHERERVMRLVYRLRAHVRRCDGAPDVPRRRVVLFVDGLDAVRRVLDDVATADEFDALEEVLADGEANGITIVATVEQAAAVPIALLARCPHRWVFHLHDAHDGALVGVAALSLPAAGAPGRLVIAATGLVAQLVRPGSPALFEVPAVGAASRAPRVEVVPPVIHPDALPTAQYEDGTTVLALGVAFATGEPHQLHLPDGEHLLVLGGPRSGRTQALQLLAGLWRTAHPSGWVGAVVPRRGRPLAGVVDALAPDTRLLDDLPPTGPVLIVVDDAEAVDDPSGRLAALAAGGRPDTWVVAAGRPDALRQQYGHWTAVVRRSRTGLVLTGGGDLDGDLLGVVLPRRTPLAARPGLAWMVGADISLVQLALADAEPPTRAVAVAVAITVAESVVATAPHHPPTRRQEAHSAQ